MRLSVSLWPPLEVVEALSELDRPDVPGVHWSTPEQWLVKVRPLAHVHERIVPTLIESLENELDGAPVVPCVLGPATRRLAGQWLGAPVTGLEDLASAVFEATAGVVPVTHPQPFAANIVLARGRVPKELAGHPVSTAWTADSVCLVADRSSSTYARFEDLAAITLGVRRASDR